MRSKNKRDFKFIKNLVHAINDDLKKSHEYILESSVLPEAKLYAGKNLPEQNAVSIEPYVTRFKGQYKALKKEISMKLQGGIQKLVGTTAMVNLNEKIEIQATEIKNETDRIRNLETDRDRIVVFHSKKAFQQQQWKLNLFGLADSLWSSSCFLKFGDIVLVAVFVGTILGLAQVYGVKATILNIKEVTDPEKKRRYIKLAIAGYAVVSLILGAIRYSLAHSGTASDMPFIFLNPLTFAIFNMVFLIAAALLVLRYFPSKSDEEKLHRIAEIEGAIKKLNAHKIKLEETYNELLDDRQSTVKIHGEIIHDEQKLLEKVAAYYDEAIGMFKSENISKRTDGIYPGCFKHPHTSLSDDDMNHFSQIQNK